MSFVFSFGRFGGFKFQIKKDFVRIVFGFVGLIIMNMDIDDFLGKIEKWKEKIK